MCLELSHVPGHETHPAPWSRTAWGRGGDPPIPLCPARLGKSSGKRRGLSEFVTRRGVRDV